MITWKERAVAQLAHYLDISLEGRSTTTTYFSHDNVAMIEVRTPQPNLFVVSNDTPAKICMDKIWRGLIFCSGLFKTTLENVFASHFICYRPMLLISLFAGFYL